MYNLCKKLKNFIILKKKGVIAVEWIILSPLILFTIFLNIMILIFVLDSILYSNACSDLAQELNLGDTGYKNYTSGALSLQAKEYKNDLIASAGLSNYLGEVPVEITTTSTGEGAFENAFYFHLTKFLEEGRFDCPYATLRKIDARVYNGSGEVNNFSTDPLHTESGDMVQISVTYEFLVFTVTKYGYSFII